MPSSAYPRRRILKTSSLLLIGLAGCQSGATPTESTGDDSTRITALSVQDYVVYPLSGTHPHVHRRAKTQYIIVSVHPATEDRSIWNHLSLTLNAESMLLANQQPVPWENDTADVAFAIPKSATYDSGRVLIDGKEVHSLSTATLNRLNNPPVFAVSNVSVSPEEIQAGVTTDARVEFDVRNTGEASGEFAASLSGNYVSGSHTVTGTVEANGRRQFDATTTVVGSGDTALVRLDWGADQWRGSIPVVGEQSTESGTTDETTSDESAASDALVIESSHAVEGTMVNLGAEGIAHNTASQTLVDCVIVVSGDVGGETFTGRATRERLAPDEQWEWAVTFGGDADASSDDSVTNLATETRAAYAE